LPAVEFFHAIRARYKMQIQSPQVIHDNLSATFKFNGDLDAEKISISQTLDSSAPKRQRSARKKSTSSNMNRISASVNPTCSWRERVLELFDPALQDAEDMMLSLPYAAIREKTHTIATILDDVASEQLCPTANRHLSSSWASTGPDPNRTKLSVACTASEIRGKASFLGRSSTISLASLASPREPSKMAKIMCVRLSLSDVAC
jgi:hypothetical protein